jgi:DNA polymerase-3 subunit alpha
MGQGSIFDLFDAAPAADESPFNAPTHPPIPIEEFDRNELLAMEKESIGIFISEHPLKRVREALTMKSDCSTAEVMNRRNDEWIKVGGMITESKKIRTRSGSTMMFATLSDLEGSVEIVVFEKALNAAEGVIADDAIVLIRGKVDHKEAGKVCVIVQEVELFDPSDAEIERAKAHAEKVAATRPSAFKRRVDAAQLPATVIDDLRELFERYPGDMEFVLIMQTRTGERRLKFGDAFKVKAGDAGFKAELNGLLPPVAVTAAV